MKALLDTNVLLDFVLLRQPFAADATTLWVANEQGRYEAYISGITLAITDYEDAVQHASATASGLDAIVTRNIADYRRATLPVFTPADFLAQLAP